MRHIVLPDDEIICGYTLTSEEQEELDIEQSKELKKVFDKLDNLE